MLMHMVQEEFFQLYESTAELLRPLIGATNENIHILSGEGMVGLWGCLNSVLRHGERVLAVGNGIYGVGIGEMAKQRGAQVRTVQYVIASHVQHFHSPFEVWFW
jgi:aspartate aminotransferase-like enzyme